MDPSSTKFLGFVLDWDYPARKVYPKPREHDYEIEDNHSRNHGPISTPRSGRNGWVNMKIVKGMPGLKQAPRLANEILVHHLAPYGYAPVQHTPSLWKHESNGILFSLLVDDFGIKSTSESATSHLLQSLRDKYQITVDPNGTKFLGFVFDWDYPARKVYFSMPNYVQHALR